MRSENPPGESCDNCCFAFALPGGVKSKDNPAGLQYNCHEGPPKLTLIQVRGPVTPGNPDGLYNATRGDFPPIQPSFWCGHWATEEGDDEPAGRVVEGQVNGPANGS